MPTLHRLVDKHRVDAAVAWLATVGLVVTAGRFVLASEYHWVAFVALLVGVSLVPTLATRDLTVTMPGELMDLVAVLVRVSHRSLRSSSSGRLAGSRLCRSLPEALTPYAPRFARLPCSRSLRSREPRTILLADSFAVGPLAARA